MQRRVVITGLGVIAPNGIGKGDFWRSCVAGRSGIGRITRFDASALSTQIAGEVTDFQPETLGITAQELQSLDRGSQFALAAANQALQDAALTGELSEEERNRFGVFQGSAMASCEEGENVWLQLSNARPDTNAAEANARPDTNAAEANSREVRGQLLPSDQMGLHSEYLSGANYESNVGTQNTKPEANPERGDSGRIRSLINPPAIPGLALLSNLVPASVIAAHHRLHGPCTTISTGCSAGADAIGEAFWAIQEGRADRMLAGGSDSATSYGVLSVFGVMRALSTRNAEPERASRPYDGLRDGFVLAEGAGILLLEERELALARGVPIYAEVIAFASTSNAYHMTALPDDGLPLQHLLRQALTEAGITSAQLDYINSHGSSTLPNEKAETAAYKAVFGADAYHIPISSTKSMIGHTQGAASAIEAVVTALAVAHQVIPPTINQEQADPLCDLDYVPNVARTTPVNVALTHSSGFGGVNSALIFARPDWSDEEHES